MLRNTFVHIQGIGEKTEKRLWNSGIRTWDDFLARETMVFSPGRDRMIRDELSESIAHIADPGWFQKRLSSAHAWRLYGEYREKTAFLDIETARDAEGLIELTVVGVYGAGRMRQFVSGRNMEDFEAAIADFDLLVTFNGTGFDVPVLKDWFRHLNLPPGHVDLRFALRRLGLSGGLKAIEKKMGIQRAPAIDGLTGLDAETLWRAHLRGDPEALNLLLSYNAADSENLFPLMEHAFKELGRRCGFPVGACV
ncbi:MAG: ribonuclease H-like domain-containing protein [Thermodesulfobacteriota bacterium]